MNVLNEYDVVYAKRALSPAVQKKCRGTIVMVYNEPDLAYEVEFIEKGETLDLLTVHPEDIEFAYDAMR